MTKQPKMPRPGRPVRGSRSGRPIMAILDLLGRRWALRVLWELRSAPATFRELQERCGGVSPTVLNVRLKELRETKLVALTQADGYGLTRSGSELLTVLGSLDRWATKWASKQAPPAKPTTG